MSDRVKGSATVLGDGAFSWRRISRVERYERRSLELG